MSDELDVWDVAFIAWDGFPTDPSKIGDANQAATTVIRDYGDKRYQQAIADVVEWLRKRASICDDWEWEEDWIEADAYRKAASQIIRLFGNTKEKYSD